MRKICFFDSTLCEGERSPGCSMNLNEKLELAKQLERLGVDVIEAGYPISSPDDFEAVQKISLTVRDAAVCAVARLVENDIKRAWEALKGAKTPRLKLFMALSDEELKGQFMSRSDAIEATAAMVKFARRLCPDVEFAALSVARADQSFLMHVLDTAVAAGAGTICLTDSMGYCLPGELSDLVRYVAQHLQNPNVLIAVHSQNDLGLALANTLECIRAGAAQITGTINGIGERAGNASLEEVAMALHSRRDFYDCEAGLNHREIYRTSKLLSTITGIGVSPHKPIVGVNALSYSSKPQNMAGAAHPYAAISPEEIGLSQKSTVLGKSSGRDDFAQRIGDLGYRLEEAVLEEAYGRFQRLAERKREIDDRDLEALLMGHAGEFKETYQLKSYVINCGTVISATAVISLVKDTGEVFEKVARGEGPIDAAFKAIDRIVEVTGTLKNWTIQAVTEGEDALGEAVSKIICNGKLVTGRGLSTDILEASIKSYLNAINKALALGSVTDG